MEPAGWEWPNRWHPREQDLIRFRIFKRNPGETRKEADGTGHADLWIQG